MDKSEKIWTTVVAIFMIWVGVLMTIDVLSDIELREARAIYYQCNEDK